MDLNLAAKVVPVPLIVVLVLVALVLKRWGTENQQDDHSSQND